MIYQYAIAQDEFTKNENLIMDVSGNFLTRAEAAAAAPGSWIVNNESLASKFEEFVAGEYIHLNSIIGDNPYWKENSIRDQNLLMGAILWKHHWWCYALDRSQKKLYVLDSIHCEPPNEDRRKLDKLVSRRLEELLALVDPKYKVSNKGFSIIYADVPKQSNGYDCGVYSYKYMELWNVGMKLPQYTEGYCKLVCVVWSEPNPKEN
ncbi:hypothetical protein AAHE18_02G132100 [Arachis hypogaea]